MKKTLLFVVAALVLSVLFVGCNVRIDGDLSGYNKEKGLSIDGQHTTQGSDTQQEEPCENVKAQKDSAGEEELYTETEEVFVDYEENGYVPVETEIIETDGFDSNTQMNGESESSGIIETPIIEPEYEEITISFKLRDVEETKFVTGKQILSVIDNDDINAIEISSDKADALVFEVRYYSDGTVTLGAEGYFLACNGNDVQFVTERNEHTRFVLENSEGGKYSYFIRSSVILDGNPQYLKLCGDLLTFGKMDGSNMAIYTFTFTDPEGADGHVTLPDTNEQTSDPPLVDTQETQADMTE